MQGAHGKQVKADDDVSAATAYGQYLKDRHDAHLLRRNSLCDFAFKTSERYDQWVLTLSGGALAISLTFLEKIAPDPVPVTLVILGGSWLAYILAALTGFCAIYFSREALYTEVEIGDEAYTRFRETTTEQKPEGDPPAEWKNRHTKTLKKLSVASSSCLILGTFLMCAFALTNISRAKSKKEITPPVQINVTAQPPQLLTNNNSITNSKP